MMTSSEMTASSEPVRLSCPSRWLSRAPALTVVGLVVALATYPLVRLGAGTTGGDAVAVLVGPPSDGLTAWLRVVLLAATAVTAGLALVGAVLPLGSAVPPVASRVRVTAWVGALTASVGCAVAVAAGQAAWLLGALQLLLLVAVPLLLTGRRSAVTAALGLVGPVLVGLLAIEFGTGRTGLPLVLDVGYAVAGSVLLGASVFGASVFGAFRPADGRLTATALIAGVLTSLAGFAQLAASGPRTSFDLLHTDYGVAALAQAGLPVLVTLAWAWHAAGRPRSAGLVQLATGGLVLAFAAGAILATMPRPAEAPMPGQPLLRPLDLGTRHLALLMLPMRPGLNLVHIGDSGGQAMPTGHHHGGPQMSAMPGALTVSAGGSQVLVAARAGAPGGWAVLNIPSGAKALTITGDGVPATVPINVGTAPADPAVQGALAGPDGPECASVVFGALVAGGTPDQDGCPSQRLTASDAGTLRDAVEFLAQRGITTLDLVSDASPRGVAAAGLIRAEAARRRLAVSTAGTSTGTLLVVSGWASAAAALTEQLGRAGAGETVLAPWLLTGQLLSRASSEVLPLTFDPQEDAPRRYAATLAAIFPGETPSAGGYLSWARYTGARVDKRATFYGAAPVDVPMGMDDMDMNPADQPANWYPNGAIVAISPALGPPGGRP